VFWLFMVNYFFKKDISPVQSVTFSDNLAFPVALVMGNRLLHSLDCIQFFPLTDFTERLYS